MIGIIRLLVIIYLFSSYMDYHISSKGFELREAQKFSIDRGMAKIDRLCKNFESELVHGNVVISCHQEGTPVFTSHVYLELPGAKLSAMATARKFGLSYNQALKKLRTQLKKYKESLKEY